MLRRILQSLQMGMIYALVVLTATSAYTGFIYWSGQGFLVKAALSLILPGYGIASAWIDARG